MSKRNAKAVFGLGPAEFNALPCCGYRNYYVFWNEGISYDKGIRDCAAAVLKRLGSFKKLAEEAPLLRQNEPLQRLQGVIAELQKLHPTLQGAHFKAIQNCAKRLTLRKSFRLKHIEIRSANSAKCEAHRAAVTQALHDLTLYIGAPFCSPHLMAV